jgi:hypothetical protein
VDGGRTTGTTGRVGGGPAGRTGCAAGGPAGAVADVTARAAAERPLLG